MTPMAVRMYGVRGDHDRCLEEDGAEVSIQYELASSLREQDRDVYGRDSTEAQKLDTKRKKQMSL